jgi:hypothetical protein
MEFATDAVYSVKLKCAPTALRPVVHRTDAADASRVGKTRISPLYHPAYCCHFWSR